MYTTYQRREQTSWKSWSRINTPEAAKEEAGRIGKELAALAAGAGFPLEILPLVTVTTPEQARQVHDKDYDVVLIYPATGSGTVLRRASRRNRTRTRSCSSATARARSTTGTRP